MPTKQRTIAEAMQAEAASRAEFERKTVAFLADGKPVTIAEARAVFEKYHHTPGTDWKRPVDAIVYRPDLEKFMQAVRFYHGCESHTVTAERMVASMGMRFRVRGPGYAC